MSERYSCPYTGDDLSLAGHDQVGEDVVSGTLSSSGGLDYPIVEGMPHLLRPERETYAEDEAREKEYYEETARSYDEILDWLFRSFYEDEHEVRAEMIDLLEVEQGHRILETGAGTCRDTMEIARRLGPEGELFVQDLSPSMLSIGRERMREEGHLDGSNGQVEFFIGNAVHLPFADNSFDSAYHFGGFNLFSDQAQALSEMARVVKVGGKVVVGDEGVGPWLRDREYGAILMNSNQLYTYTPPLEALPETARHAGVRWLIGEAFYVIDFRVGDGPPRVDLDLPIMGRRGGTHRSRYFGRLEGVTLEAKSMAEAAADASGLSLHEWLDQAVRNAAAGRVDQG